MGRYNGSIIKTKGEQAMEKGIVAVIVAVVAVIAGAVIIRKRNR